MDWILQYRSLLLTTVTIGTILFTCGWLSDNIGYHPHKRWSKSETLMVLLLIFGIGFMFVGIVMGMDLIQKPFVFERLFTTMSIVLIGISMLRYGFNRSVEKNGKS